MVLKTTFKFCDTILDVEPQKLDETSTFSSKEITRILVKNRIETLLNRAEERLEFTVINNPQIDD